MKQRVLLIDTNFSSIPIYNYLSETGYEVFIAGGNPDDYMAKSFKNYIHIDYSDIEKLRTKTKQIKIDFFIPGCNDLSYEIASILNDDKGYLHIDKPSVTNTLNNKKKFRRFLMTNNLQTPSLIENPQFDIIKNGNFIIKPVDSFSGKGVSVLNSPTNDQYEKAVSLAKSASRCGDYLAEEFVEGQLYSHSAFIYKRKIIKDFFVAEYGFINRFTVDTSYIDTEISDLLKNKVKCEIEKIADLLNLCDGLIHTQFIFNKKKFWLIEITRRCPGDLYSKLIELSSGYPYTINYIRGFLGESDQYKNYSPEKKIKRYIIRHTVTQDSYCRFFSLKLKRNLRFLEYVSLVTTGKLLEPSPKGRVGILFIYAHSKKQRRKIIRQCLNKKIYEIEATNEKQ